MKKRTIASVGLSNECITSGISTSTNFRFKRKTKFKFFFKRTARTRASNKLICELPPIYATLTLSLQVQVKNGMKCGVCGDNYKASRPRANENTGRYGKGVIVKKYQSGQVWRGREL